MEFELKFIINNVFAPEATVYMCVDAHIARHL